MASSCLGAARDALTPLQYDYSMNYAEKREVIRQAEQEILERVEREIKKVIDENDDGFWGCRESFDDLLTSLKDTPTL